MIQEMIQEMNDQSIIEPIIERLNRVFEDISGLSGQSMRIMEVCGTHTRAIAKSGIRYLLPQEILLLSGPGCPVCVTPEYYIDIMISIADREDVILVTFGDMMKVQGTCFSLSDKKAQGAQITVVYSPEDALNIAAHHRDKLVVFVAVGFETTAPLIGVTVKQAKAGGLDNLFFLTALKRMEPVIRFILQDERNKINAMICPGHVASITGAEHFRFITEEFGIPAVVCGFESQDIAAGICRLLEQLTGKRDKKFVNLYQRCVTPNGNPIAQQMINEVFDIADGEWRGIGTIRNSALVLNDQYRYLDAVKRFEIKNEQYSSPLNCLCSEILLGLKLPKECRLFGSICTPEHPSGPCMVSSEGACAAHFKFGGDGKNG
ncbi:hydrogenase formation protein HypD [Dehalobacterium formicoaceticum]|uniref:Hydrogenase formation protein HypD n=1 Tax=Dehalobacterium formicoaceticum TaxID=51515 RepID=A0ABT1YAB8_9FIRM|nr:hydrogenase formation protein HypD [Dehalobacterium formicoaceticum]MCR6546596.1 hydrogenase formation protein HypD [Dehalobacterium formicoaceticum]